MSDRQIESEVSITPFDKGEKKPGKISSGLSSMGYDVRLGYKFRVFKPYPCSVIDPKNFDSRMLEEVDITPTFCKFEPSFNDESGEDDFICTQCRFYSHNSKTPDKERRCPYFYQPDHILIPPHSFVLGESLETFDIPRDILVVALGKSTYARCGLVVNVTPGEPEWVGKWTIELSNTTPIPMKVYTGEGIMQCLFFRSDEKDRVVRDAVDTLMEARGIQVRDLYREIVKKSGCRISYKDRKGKYQDQKGLTNPFVEGGNGKT